MQDVHVKLNPGLPWQKQHSAGRRLKFEEETSKVLHLEQYGVENWTLRKVDQKYLESFEMWCWRRIEGSWTDRVGNEVLHRAKEERSILYTTKRRKANCIDYISHRNCLLKHVVEGKIEGRIEVTGRRGRRSKQLLDDIKETVDLS